MRHKIVTTAVVRLADELHGNRRKQVLDFLITLKKGERIKGEKTQTHETGENESSNRQVRE